MAHSEPKPAEARPRLVGARRGLRRLTVGLLALGMSGGLVGLLLVGWFLSEQRYVAFLEHELERVLGADVEIAASRLSLRQGVGVQFKTVSVHEEGTPTPVVTADRIDLVLDWQALLRGHLLFREVFVLRPRVQLAPPPSNAASPPLIARLFARPAAPFAPDAEPEAPPSAPPWFAPELSVRQLVLEEATLVLQPASGGVPVVFTHARLRLAWDAGGVWGELRAALGRNGESGRLTLRSRAPHQGPSLNAVPLEWTGDLHLKNVALQAVGVWLGADWPAARVDFSGRYAIDLSIRQIVLKEATLVLQQTSDGVPVIFTHAQLRIALDAGGVGGELSTDLGQNGEVGQLVFRSHVTPEELTPNTSPAEWRGDLHLQNVAIQEVGAWFGADWPAARVDFRGEYTGKAQASTTVSGRVQVREGRFAHLTVQQGGLGLTDMQWENPASAASWWVAAPLAGLLESLTSRPHAFRFQAALEEVQGRFGKTNISLRLTAGQIRLQDGQLHVSHLKGTYGRASVLRELEAEWTPLFAQQPPTLTVHLITRLNLAEDGVSLFSFVPDAERQAFLQAVQQPSGQADIRLSTQLPPGRRARPLYDATVEWRSAGMALPEWGLTLSEVNGAVHLTPEEARLQELRFRIGASTGVLEGTIERPFTASRQGRVVLSIPQATVQDVVPLLDGAMVQPQVGQFRGQVEARFGPGGSRLETEGQLILSEGRIDIPSFLEPLNIMRGQVSWRGQQGRFVIEQGLLSGARVTGTGEVRSLEPVELDMAVKCGDLDLDSILISESARQGKQKTEEKSPESARQGKQKTAEQNKVRVDVHCDRMRYKTLSAAPVRASVDQHGRQVDFRLEEAGVAAGHVRGEGTFWLDSSALSFAPQVSQVDTADFFAALGLPLSGTLDASGNIALTSWEFWNDLEAWDGELALSVHDGVAQRLPMLMRLWTAIQLPQISRAGLPFSSLTGDVVVKHGKLTAKNLSFVGKVVRLDARGQVNLRQKVLDITGDVTPLRGITSIVEKVPLVGKLFAQSTDRLTTLPFQVSGPYHDPQVQLKKPILKMNLEFGLD